VRSDHGAEWELLSLHELRVDERVQLEAWLVEVIGGAPGLRIQTWGSRAQNEKRFEDGGLQFLRAEAHSVFARGGQADSAV
jgi:hypothetical protein